jgi:3-oxoacyl-[acyl-carrier protein] reductase
MELNLKNKSALVTGGGNGIGAGISEALAEEGVNIALTYNSDKEKAEKFGSYLKEKYNINCRVYKADVSKKDQVETLSKEVISDFKTIEILVNNAGIWPTEGILEMPDENWEKVININLNGTYFLSKRISQHMIEKGIKGNIICVSSKSSFQYNTPGHAHYAVAKAGINMFIRTLARELTPSLIRVNGIAPGMVRTSMNEDKWSDPEIEKYYFSRIPVGRLALPIEMGYAVAFLVSDKAFNVNGTVLDVTGGMMI